MKDSSDQIAPMPSREELQAELLNIPELPEQPSPREPPSLDHILAVAVRHIRGRRGADLVSIILVGSGARRALTPHSNLNLIALVKGQDEGEEIVRIAERIAEIRYRGHKAVEQELPHALRLPPLLRKGRVLFDYEAIGAKLVERANQRFRQGPPPAGLNEKIRLKAECLHRLGKAEDLVHHPATTHYLLGRFLEDLLQAFFRLRGYWPTTPADMLRFIASRDAELGALLDRFMNTTAIPERVSLGRQLVDLIFKDIPNPARID